MAPQTAMWRAVCGDGSERVAACSYCSERVAALSVVRYRGGHVWRRVAMAACVTACGDDSEGVAACGKCYARGGGWKVVALGEPVVAVTSSTWQRTGRACSDDGERVV